jgi:hypothetical protein
MPAEGPPDWEVTPPDWEVAPPGRTRYTVGVREVEVRDEFLIWLEWDMGLAGNGHSLSVGADCISQLNFELGWWRRW